MRSPLYDAVEEETRNEFELLAELGGGDAWAAFLGRRLAGPRSLAILLLQAVDDDGEFDLETVEALDDGLPLGRTACPACGSAAEGWPRFCPACGADVVPGGSAELLDEVRAATAGVFDVLGEMPHAEGGALYFAREAETGRVVALTLRHEADGGLGLEVCWTPSAAGESGGGDASAETDGPDGAAAFDEPPASVPFAPADFVDDAPRPFFGAPAGRPRERARRTAGVAALAVIGVALAAALVISIIRPDPANVEAAALARDASAPTPAASPGPASPAAPEQVPDPASPALADAPAPEPAARVPPPAPRPTTVSLPAPAPNAVAVRPAEPETRPVAVVVPEPAAAPAPDGITDAIGRYAAAVQSRQTSRLSRAYPGITRAEVERWERFFRPLAPDAGLQARYDVLKAPTVSGTRGEILFTLTLSYADASGRPATLPLPLRGILEWTGAGWSLQEVRSYP